MKKEKISCYENFPGWIVFVANLLSIAIYAIGFCIMLQLGLIYAILYLFYVGFVEIMVLKRSCRNCYYYGKVCAFGKGKICSLFFKKGHPKKFIKREVRLVDILPDFLVSIIPFVVGIIVLIKHFTIVILLFLIILLILGFLGNSLVRGKIACRYCKQRELGCPAQKLFDKKDKKKKIK